MQKSGEESIQIGFKKSLLYEKKDYTFCSKLQQTHTIRTWKKFLKFLKFCQPRRTIKIKC